MMAMKTQIPCMCGMAGSTRSSSVSGHRAQKRGGGYGRGKYSQDAGGSGAALGRRAWRHRFAGAAEAIDREMGRSVFAGFPMHGRAVSEYGHPSG